MSTELPANQQQSPGSQTPPDLQPFNPIVINPLPKSLTEDDQPRRRPRGKIRRLPRPVREKLNQLLDDGLDYKAVIAALGQEAAHLIEMDVSRWYTTGHQDWIKNQTWLENTCARLDMAAETVLEHKETSIHTASLHVAATQLIEHLLRKGENLLAENSEAYVALVNSVTRLSHQALNLQKFSEACAQARAEINKLKDPTRKFTDEETRAVVDRLDHILGFK